MGPCQEAVDDTRTAVYARKYPDGICAAAQPARTRSAPMRPGRLAHMGMHPSRPSPTGDPVTMPGPGPDQRDRSRNRRPRRRTQAGGYRAPVTEYEEQQELEAAKERNDLDVSDLREMSVNELRQVGRELELETATADRKDDLVEKILERQTERAGHAYATGILD